MVKFLIIFLVVLQCKTTKKKDEQSPDEQKKPIGGLSLRHQVPEGQTTESLRKSKPELDPGNTPPRTYPPQTEWQTVTWEAEDTRNMTLHLPTEIRYPISPELQQKFNVAASVTKRMAETMPEITLGEHSLAPDPEALDLVQVTLQSLMPQCSVNVSDKIGEGSYGAVFAAQAVECHDQVETVDLALKWAEGSAVQENEHKFLDLFNGHQHAVRYYGSFSLGEDQVIVMSREVSSIADQEPPYALDRVEQLVAILELLESKRVMHRDIKPDNLLLGQDGLMKVGDLGSATTIPSPCGYWCKKTLADGVYTPGFLDPNRYAASTGVVPSGWELLDADHFSAGVSLLVMFWGSYTPLMVLCAMVSSGSRDAEVWGAWLNAQTDEEFCVSKLSDRGMWDGATEILQTEGDEEEQMFSSFLWGTASRRPSREEYRENLKAYVARQRNSPNSGQ